MIDLISRQAAIDAIRPLQTYKLGEGDSLILISKAEVQTELMMLPSADAVEVVRCKYCDFWNDWDSAGKDSLGNHVCSCAYWTREDGPVVYTADNDFCSNGDRRGEEDESMD